MAYPYVDAVSNTKPYTFKQMIKAYKTHGHIFFLNQIDYDIYLGADFVPFEIRETLGYILNLELREKKIEFWIQAIKFSFGTPSFENVIQKGNDIVYDKVHNIYNQLFIEAFDSGEIMDEDLIVMKQEELSTKEIVEDLESVFKNMKVSGKNKRSDDEDDLIPIMDRIKRLRV